MSPPRIVFGEDLDIVTFVEFVGRQDAEFGTGAKENDRDHQGAGEIERVRPSESEIVGHGGGSIRERGRSPLDGSQRSNPGRDHRTGPGRSAARMRSRPRSGLIVTRPRFDGMPSIRAEVGFASRRVPSRPHRTDSSPKLHRSATRTLHADEEEFQPW